MTFPAAGPRPAIDPPAQGRGRAGHVRERIRSSRLRERVKPGGTIAVGIGSRGIHGIDVSRPGHRRHAQGDGLQALHRRRDGQPRRCHRRGPARAAGRLRRDGRGDGRPGQDRHGHRRAGDQPGRAADLLRPQRLPGRRHRPGQSRQAAHRLPRRPRVGRPQDAGDRPGQARRRQPGPQAGHPGPLRGPAGRRPVRWSRRPDSPWAWRSSRTPRTAPPRSSPSSPRRSSTSSRSCSSAPAA